MFTGIIQAYCPVKNVVRHDGQLSFAVQLTKDISKDIPHGGSIAIDGVCLTVVKQEQNDVYFDVIGESLERTTLNALQEGDLVNVERSAKVGDEIGGHRVSGHVIGTAEIVQRETHEDNVAMQYFIPKEWMRFILQKGFIALDGASLTVVDPQTKEDQGLFWVHLIPETLRMTGFGKKDVGERVNVEIDPMTQAIVETVERVMRKED